MWTSLFLAPGQKADALLGFSTFLGGGFREEDNTRAWPYSCCAKTSNERKRLVAQAPESCTLGLGKCYQFPALTVLEASVPLCPIIPFFRIYLGTLEGIFVSQLPWREDWECSLLQLRTHVHFANHLGGGVTTETSKGLFALLCPGE